MRTFGLSARPRIVPSDAVAADAEGAGAEGAGAAVDAAGVAGVEDADVAVVGAAGGSADAGIAIAAMPNVRKPRATYFFTITSMIALGRFRASRIGSRELGCRRCWRSTRRR